MKETKASVELIPQRTNHSTERLLHPFQNIFRAINCFQWQFLSHIFNFVSCNVRYLPFSLSSYHDHDKLTEVNYGNVRKCNFSELQIPRAGKARKTRTECNQTDEKWAEISVEASAVQQHDDYAFKQRFLNHRFGSGRNCVIVTD